MFQSNLWYNSAHQVKHSYYQHLSGCVVTPPLWRDGSRQGSVFLDHNGWWIHKTKRPLLPLHKNTTGPLRDCEVRERGLWRHLRPTFPHSGQVVVFIFHPGEQTVGLVSRLRQSGQNLCTPEAGSLVEGSVCEAQQARVVLTAAGRNKLYHLFFVFTWVSHETSFGLRRVYFRGQTPHNLKELSDPSLKTCSGEVQVKIWLGFCCLVMNLFEQHRRTE